MACAALPVFGIIKGAAKATDATLATEIDQPFVGKAVAIIINAVAGLWGDITTAAACILDPFVDEPITVIVDGVALFIGEPPTIAAGVPIGRILVDGAITVIVERITFFDPGANPTTTLGVEPLLAGNGPGRTLHQTGTAHADAHGIRRSTIAIDGGPLFALTALFDPAIAVIIEAVITGLYSVGEDTAAGPADAFVDHIIAVVVQFITDLVPRLASLVDAAFVHLAVAIPVEFIATLVKDPWNLIAHTVAPTAIDTVEEATTADPLAQSMGRTRVAGLIFAPVTEAILVDLHVAIVVEPIPPPTADAITALPRGDAAKATGIGQPFVGLSITVVIDAITRLPQGNDLTGARNALAAMAYPLAHSARAYTASPIGTAIAGLSHGLDAAAVLVFFAITVVVHPIAILDGRGATAVARVAHLLVNAAVAIIVSVVTHLDGQIATCPTGIGHILVDHAVTVVVDPVTGFLYGHSGLDTLAHHPVYAHLPANTAAADTHGPGRTGVTLDRLTFGAATALIGPSVTIVIETISTLLSCPGMGRVEVIITVGTGGAPLPEPVAIEIDARIRCIYLHRCIDLRCHIVLPKACGGPQVRNQGRHIEAGILTAAEQKTCETDQKGHAQQAVTLHLSIQFYSPWLPNPQKPNMCPDQDTGFRSKFPPCMHFLTREVTSDLSAEHPG